MTKKNTARLVVDHNDPLLSPTPAVQRQRAAEENFNWPPPEPAGSPKHRVSSQWVPAGHEKEYAMMKENDPPTQGIHWFPVRSGNNNTDSMAMVGEDGLGQTSMMSLEESFEGQTNLNNLEGIAAQNSSFISQKQQGKPHSEPTSPTKIVQDSRKPPAGVNRAYSQKGTAAFAYEGPNHGTRTQSQLRELVHSPGPNKYLPNIKATRVEVAKNIKFTGGDRQSTMFPFARNEPCTLGLPGPGSYFQQATSPPPRPRMKKKKKKKPATETNPSELPDPLETELNEMEGARAKGGVKKKHARSKSAGGFVSSFGLTWVNGMPMERVQDGRKRSTMDTQAPVNSSMRSRTPNHLPPTSAAKQKSAAETPSPGAYTPNINVKYKRYASFGFGSSARKTVFDVKTESPGPQYFPDYAFTSQIANPSAAPIGGHVGGGNPMHSIHSPPRPATHLGNARRSQNVKSKAKKRIMEAQKAGSITATEDSEGSVIGMMDLDNQPVFDATEGSESGSVSVADSVILRTSLDKKVKEKQKKKGQRIHPHRPRVKDPPKFADPGTYSPNYSLIFKSSFGPKIGSESRMKWMGNWEGTKGNSPGPKYNPRTVFNSEHERAPGAMLNLCTKRLLDHPEDMYATAQVKVPEMNYHEKKKEGKKGKKGNTSEEHAVEGAQEEDKDGGDPQEENHEAEDDERPKSAGDILDEAIGDAERSDQEEKEGADAEDGANEGVEEADGGNENDDQDDHYDDFEDDDDDVEIEPLAEDLGESVRPSDKENLAAEMLHDDNLWAGVEENYEEEFEDAESSMEGSRGQSRGEDRTASIISNKNPMYADEDIGERTGTRAATRTTTSRGRSRGSGPTASVGENSTSLATFNEDDANEASGEYVEDPDNDKEAGNGNGFDGMFA